MTGKDFGILFIIGAFKAYFDFLHWFAGYEFGEIIGKILFGVLFISVIYIVYRAQKNPKKYGTMPLTLPKFNKNLEKRTLIYFFISLLVASALILFLLLKIGAEQDGYYLVGGLSILTVYGLVLYFEILKA